MAERKAADILEEVLKETRDQTRLMLLLALDQENLFHDKQMLQPASAYAQPKSAYKNMRSRPVGVRFVVTTASANAIAQVIIGFGSDLTRRLAPLPAGVVGAATPHMLIEHSEEVYAQISDSDIGVIMLIADPLALKFDLPRMP